MSNLAPQSKTPQRLAKENKQKRAGAIAGAVAGQSIVHIFPAGLVFGAGAGYVYAQNENYKPSTIHHPNIKKKKNNNNNKRNYNEK